MSNKPRRLWLKVLFKVPAGTPRDKIKSVLIESVRSGTYELPLGWKAAIQWRNKENAPMKSGEWTRELLASAKSSSGFDKAVISYLENI